MLSLDLEWLAPITKIRSDRWLDFYMRCFNGVHKIERKVVARQVNQLALADNQFYQSDMHRVDDANSARIIWQHDKGLEEGNPLAVIKTLALMQKRLLQWQGSHFSAYQNQLKHWAAIIAKVDPVWLLAAGYSQQLTEQVVRAEHVIKLAAKQCFAVLPKSFDGNEYADNHVHLGGHGNCVPALAEFSFTLQRKKSLIKDLSSSPKLNEFPKYCSGELDINDLPPLVKILFHYLVGEVFSKSNQKKDQCCCAPVNWLRPAFWQLPDESAAALIHGRKANTTAQKLLAHAIHCCNDNPNQKWLLSSAAFIHHANEVGSKNGRYHDALSAYITANNILRSMMISSGVGLTSFIEHFSFSPRKGSNQLLPYSKHSQLTDASALTLREFKIGDGQISAHSLARLGKNLIANDQLGRQQYTFHFSRSLKGKEIDRVKHNRLFERQREQLLPRLRDLQGTLGSASLQQHDYVDVGRKDTETLNLTAMVRGIDVAGNENHLPIEVFAPTIRVLRAGLFYPDEKMFQHQRKMHLSIHAGEDFSHVLTGLRNIDETVEFCDYQAGDRIGHALALGVDVKQWVTRQQRAYVNVVSHLDNLVWSYHHGLELVKKAPEFYGMLAILQQKISHWSSYVYDKPHEPHVLYQAWLLRRNCPIQYETQQKSKLAETKAWLPDVNHFDDKIEAKNLWQAYLQPQDLTPLSSCQCGKCTEKRLKYAKKNKVISIYLGDNPPPFISDELSEVVDTAELDFYEALQDHLIERYSDKGIVLEACPTSNVYIGRFKCYSEHPLYRWYPVDEKLLVKGARFNRFGLRRNPISLCVNTDDAGLFPTTIENEHRILKETAIEYFKVGSETAGRWIDRLRQIGVENFLRNHAEN